jgi:hypothetical protein
MRRTAQTYYSVALALALTVCVYSGTAFAQQTQRSVSAPAVRTEKFFRTELYFGRSIPGGGIVSEQAWTDFLAEIVTPRFPDGFTSLKAVGQYREKSGRIVSEPSEVLVFLYSGRNKDESRTKIEEIRATYLKMFKQESVLRVDLPKTVRVSF